MSTDSFYVHEEFVLWYKNLFLSQLLHHFYPPLGTMTTELKSCLPLANTVFFLDRKIGNWETWDWLDPSLPTITNSKRWRNNRTTEKNLWSNGDVNRFSSVFYWSLYLNSQASISKSSSGYRQGDPFQANKGWMFSRKLYYGRYQDAVKVLCMRKKAWSEALLHNPAKSFIMGWSARSVKFMTHAP